MKFNYRLRRLCGAYYGYSSFNSGTGGKPWGGSNLVYNAAGTILISSVSNRVQVLDLKTHAVRTLPVEARSSIRCIALSPNDTLLLVVDVENYAMIVNFHRGIVMHRMRFKHRVRAAIFSPCGRYVAVTHGKQVQVWMAPNHLQKEFAPMVLHRTYTGQSDDTTCLCWSPDSSVLIAGSRDCTVRIWSLHVTKDYEPVTLSGHKTGIVGAYIANSLVKKDEIDSIYSISEDGTLVTWKFSDSKEEDETQDTSDDMVKGSLDFFTGGKQVFESSLSSTTRAKTQAHRLVNGAWKHGSRHYFDKKQEGSTVTSTAYSTRDRILAIGFSSGVFGLYEMPSVSNIHTLSVGSGQLVKACVLNTSGEWLALGCPKSQQLLVWEWRSETYVLKQRGHAYGMRCMAYSPDGIVICTGGEDGKLKLWNANSGFCYVTLEKSHTAPVTAVCFAKSSVVLSSSLDGTVRAHDLHRYRTFKILTTPEPVQFLSLAVDPSGEIVTAGSSDPFHVYAWNLQTGKLVDVFTGHAGPVSGMAFQATGGILASASWDGTVRLWDLYKGNISTETFYHQSDLVCVTFRPDGKELCTSSIGGLLSFWDVESGKVNHEIDGRRDISGGRKMNDRMAADNNAASKYFTSVCYSADGSCVLAGGNSKYICIYHVSQEMLIKKFQVTFNRSLDGVLDELNSKKLGDGGPIDDLIDSDDEKTFNAIHLPGAKRGDDGSRKSVVEVLTMQVAFSSTGREWSTVSMEGLHVYSLDEDMIFDPISLTEAITPAAVASKMEMGDYGLALRMALHMNEFNLVRDVLEATPYEAITHIAKGAGPEHLDRLMQFISRIMEDSPHVEYYLHWCLQLMQVHGRFIEKHRASFLRVFRALHKAIQLRESELKTICDMNAYTLEYVADQARMAIERHSNKRKGSDKRQIPAKTSKTIATA